LSTAKKFAGQTAIYGLSTIISRMIYFVLTPIYTRTISMYRPMVYSLPCMAAPLLVNAVLAFGMETTYFRYLQKRSDNKQQVYNNAFGGAIIAVAVAVPGFLPAFFRPYYQLHAGRCSTKDHADYAFYVKCFLVILIARCFLYHPFCQACAQKAARLGTPL
jgi:O-antigen/teichoic acid export membrane protein